MGILLNLSPLETRSSFVQKLFEDLNCAVTYGFYKVSSLTPYFVQRRPGGTRVM